MHRPAPTAPSLQPFKVGLRGLRGPGVGAKIIGGLLAFVALLAVLAIYTPIAHPRDLQVDGATGLSASHIRAAIEEEASSQSTFRVSEDDLMAAVANYPEVAEIKIASHPPFRLDLTVVMRPPVGRVQIGGRTFTVAGDGTVLERANEAAVPKLDPSLGSLLMREGHLTGDGGALSVLSSAPDTLLEMIRTLRRGDAGLEVELQRGPRLIFGSADHAADKWAAATAVIADGAATRATYIDVRVPGRPAVGGIGGSKTAGAAGATDAPPTLTAPTGSTADSVTPQASNEAASQTGTTATPGSGTSSTTSTPGAQTPSTAAATPPAAAPPAAAAPAADATASAPASAATGAAPAGGASVSGGATP